MATELGVAYLSIVPETSKIAPGIKQALGDSSGASREAEGAGKSIGGRLSGALTKTLKVGAVTAGGAIVGTLGTALFKGFNRLKGIEQATAKLKGLGHSGATVQKIMNNALASVQGTAFGLDEASTVAAGAVAAGIKPGKQLEKTLKLVGDSATIAGTDLSSMGAIFNKVAASNKIQGDVIAQLNDAGIPIVQLLGKELGTTAEETLKLASEGKVNFATFQKAMQKGLGGAALESGKTVTGAFANMQAALGRLGAKLLGPAFASLPAFLSGLTERLDSLGPAAEKVGKVVGKAFDKAAPIIMRVRDGLQGLLALLVKGDFTSTLRKAFGWEEDSPAVGRILELRESIIKFAKIAAAAAIPVMEKIQTFMSEKLAPAVQSLAGYLASNLAPIISQAFGIFRDEVIPILSAVYTWLYTKVAPAVVDLAGKVGKNLKPVFDSLFEVIRTSILPAIQQMLAKLREWGPTIGKVVGFVGTLVGKWIEFYTTIVGKVLPVVIRFIGYVIRTMGPAISGIASNIATGIRGLVSFGTAVWNAGKAVVDFAKKVGDRIGKVVTWFKNLPGKVTSAVADAATWLWQAGKDAISGLAKGIEEGIKKYNPVNIVKGIGSKITEGFKNVLDSHSPSLVFKRIGKDVILGFAIGVTGNADRAASAMEKMYGAIDKVVKKNKLGKALAKQAKAIVAQIGKAADAYRAALEKRKDLFDSVASGLRGEWSLSEMAGLNEFGLSQGPGALVNAAAAIASRMKAFAGKLAALVKKGLPGALINEIAGYGSQEGGRIADLFLQMTKPQIASLNRSYADFNTYAASAAGVTANAVYGKDVAQAEKRLERAVERGLSRAKFQVQVGIGKNTSVKIVQQGQSQKDKRS